MNQPKTARSTNCPGQMYTLKLELPSGDYSVVPNLTLLQCVKLARANRSASLVTIYRPGHSRYQARPFLQADRTTGQTWRFETVISPLVRIGRTVRH